MTYVSVTCLRGEEGMCRGGCLQNCFVEREMECFAPSQTPHFSSRFPLPTSIFFFRVLLPPSLSVSHKESELSNSILANQESFSYFLFSLMWSLLFLPHKLSWVFSISLSLLLPMKAEADVKEMKLLPPTAPRFAASSPELHTRNS